MRQPLVIANWKLNGSLSLAKEFSEAWSSFVTEGVSAAICPPMVYIGQVAANFPEVVWGAQNCSEYEQGAYTGEVSASMIAETGAHYVLVGHSERRTLFAESNSAVAKKAQLIQSAGMTPVVCIGETLEEREAGKVSEIIEQQLQLGLADVDLTNVVIAYEPVWAIGTGVTASPEQAQEVHAEIRAWLNKQSESAAQKVQILYGGSMKPENAAELLSQTDIDGGLIGGASLHVEQFAAICKAAQGN